MCSRCNLLVLQHCFSWNVLRGEEFSLKSFDVYFQIGRTNKSGDLNPPIILIARPFR